MHYTLVRHILESPWSRPLRVTKEHFWHFGLCVFREREGVGRERGNTITEKPNKTEE